MRQNIMASKLVRSVQSLLHFTAKYCKDRTQNDIGSAEEVRITYFVCKYRTEGRIG